MASRQQTIKRWVVIASSTLVVLIAGIANVQLSESRQRDALNNERQNIQNTLQNLVIKRPGKLDIKIQAIDDQWQIHEPCTIAVNQKRLQPLLSIISPAAFSYDAAEVDLDAAGLINPLATLVANDQHIDIGNTDLSGERRYVKRGERVEFIPEWILPLLDGGLSALSTLEVFDVVITTVIIDKLEDKPNTISEDPANWQQLTAHQIAPWPLIDNALIQDQYSVIIKSGTGEKRLQVFTTAAYAALVFEGARCAYFLPNDALNASGP
jgi:hypothetical protein